MMYFPATITQRYIPSNIHNIYHFEVQWVLYVPPAFYIPELCILSTECICVSTVRYGLHTVYLCAVRTVLTANSDSFPTQH
jgi:flavin reductase (DIM6/NTAB) family NADH-FMN oxidoreductase RutF